MSRVKLFDNLFLSVGAMKAGTTWLYAVLDRHPELHFSPEKEIHYFYHRYVDHSQLSEKRRLQNARNRYLFRFDADTAHIDRVRANLHWVGDYLSSPVDDFWYRNLFHMRSGQTYACDFSNLNAHLPPEAWPQILEKCERLRVLYTMRSPIQRLWSHTKFHLQITNQLDKLDTWEVDDFAAFVRQPFIWNNAEYGKTLRSLKAGLPEENRKVIFYENLHADHRGTLHEIEEFLGVSHFNYPTPLLERRFTESAKREMPDFFPEIVSEDIARIRDEVAEEGFELPSTWTL